MRNTRRDAGEGQMRQITDWLRAIVRKRRIRGSKSLSEEQLRILRHNLSALLHTKEHLNATSRLAEHR